MHCLGPIHPEKRQSRKIEFCQPTDKLLITFSSTTISNDFDFDSPIKNDVFSNLGDNVKGVVYRTYHIVGLARLSAKTGYWTPKVRVVWRDAGREQKFELDGPPNRFRTKDEAEDYAVSMGKDWIEK